MAYDKLPKIGITQGDVNGIGTEVILKMIRDQHLLEICTPVIYGSPKAIGFYKKQIGQEQPMINIIKSATEAVHHRISIVNCCPDDLKVDMGKPSQETGKAAFIALKCACEEYQKGYIDGLVTAPINKATIQSDEFNFPGHTEYLGSIDGNTPLMMLINDNVRVALVTNHTPIADLSSSITTDLIVEKLRILNQSLKYDFGIIRPRIAVLALNPHAGDNGLIGTEEQTTIRPAIEQASQEGIMCFGPLSADGFFGASTYSKYDAILAMYHDQGLAPFKALFMDRGVNFTAGLNIIRTSPAHGTAYDIVGQGIAEESSIREALYMVTDILKHRALYNEIHANPLEIVHPEDKRRGDIHEPKILD